MPQLRDSIMRLQRTALVAAVVGVGVCAAMVWNNPERLWPAYLYGFLTCWLVSVGAMGLLALGNLTGGRWATVCRPFFLAATQSLWLVALLFVPIGLFTEHIYSWANPTTSSELPPGKAAYLEPIFFGQRAAGYFLVWLALSWLLGFVSRLDLPPASTPAMRRMGAITLVLLVPTATFAAFDWGMSLEPEWYSSIYGALLIAGGVLAAHALAVTGVATIGDRTVESILSQAGLRHPEHTNEMLGSKWESDIYNELGNLLLAFLMVNTYFALSQFLIIWTGNLPSEISWYLRRMNYGWQYLALLIVVFHFALPFLMLLSRDVKRDPGQLRLVALILLSMYAAHLYWMIIPAFPYQGTTGYLLNVAAFAAVCGVWLALFSWLTNRYLAR
ncbi:MAG TPA: hypothetical protein VIG57_12600 [Candidatus Entotheonella sp.]